MTNHHPPTHVLQPPLTPGIHAIYGPAGSGKTTYAMLATLHAARNNQRTLFLDTENGFSTERFRQIAGNHTEATLEKTFRIPLKNFKEHDAHIKKIPTLTDKFHLIIIDTLSNHYRTAYQTNKTEANRTLDMQLRILQETSRTRPVIITNQVYDDITNNTTRMIAHDLITKYAKHIIRLEKQPRKLIVEKPEKKETPITLADQGILVETCEPKKETMINPTQN